MAAVNILDRMEELEFYIGLIQEKVENFQIVDNPAKSQLNEFMTEYIDLEDKILSIIQIIPNNSEVDQEQMESLTDLFTIYWREYQDVWEKDFWDVYDMYRNLKEEKNLFTPLNEQEDILYMDTENEKEQFFENTIKDNKLSPFNHFLREKTRGSTIDYSFSLTTTNLNKIDEEMKEVQELSIIKERKEEKRRTCLDCVIF